MTPVTSGPTGAAHTRTTPECPTRNTALEKETIRSCDRDTTAADRHTVAAVLRGHIAGLKRALLTAELAAADLDPDALHADDPSPDTLIRTLLEARPDVAREIRDRVLGPILGKADRVRTVLLLDTLAAWTSCGGSAEDAAGVLYCHCNTVYLRLHEVERLTGRVLLAGRNAPFGDLFEVVLALRAHELLAAGTIGARPGEPAAPTSGGSPGPWSAVDATSPTCRAP